MSPVDGDASPEAQPEAQPDPLPDAPNGAPDDALMLATAPWFAARPAPDTELVHVVFFGPFTPAQGAPIVGAAIAALAGDPRFTFTVIGGGPEHAVARALAAPNAWVTWRAWVPAHDLPDLVARHDVCLGIFGTSGEALSFVPTEVYQAAAAGCAVITSDTAPQRAAFADAAVLVPAGDPEQIAIALRKLADDPDELTRLRRAARARARERFVNPTPHSLVRG
ncbi:glycosyltransferase [Hamadaea tsunoensis]|uniref:glycosyltransferase n=1 Tax=Hamadaea tsunoensis TaxID=53368 RepID=UPI001B7F89A2|nr:glycosyltransferase [Hamadaea tsunoensis]